HLNFFWKYCDVYEVSKTELALSFPLSYPEVSTVIPGIKTPEQAVQNCEKIVRLNSEDILSIEDYFIHHLDAIVDIMK
ncbi:MAG: hypothetical protein D6830_04905, partial [Ignavibacteria bacterium]